MAIPHGDPEKVLQSHVLIFHYKRCFPWRQHDVKLVFFLAISHKDKLCKQMMQLIANLDDSVNHLCSLDDHSLKQQLFEYPTRIIATSNSNYSFFSIENAYNIERDDFMKIVAITSCPNGIAHTYMAQRKT